MGKATIAALVLGALGCFMAPAASAHQQDTEVSAEGTEPSGADVAAMMKAMFAVEPLTAEQQARLPQAEAVIARMMPPGTLQKMMGGMFEKFMGPIMDMAGDPGSADVARELGVTDEDFELDEEKAARAAAIIDPAWKERRTAEAEAMQRSMTAVMAAMEPSMRKGMAEAYAATFTSAELTDIGAFFATPSGASFASKSYALASDPRLIAAAMEGMPAMMDKMKAIEADMKAATASLPPRRGYEDLTRAQREELAKLTGLKPGALREGMERAAMERAEAEAAKAAGETGSDETTEG